MSLILEAINRSQRERANPGEVPGVATQHYSEATVAPGAWRQGLLGLALVMALGAIAWLLLRPQIPTPSALSSGGSAVDVPAEQERAEPASSSPVSTSAVEPPGKESSQGLPAATPNAVRPGTATTLSETPASASSGARASASRRGETPAAVAALYADQAAPGDTGLRAPEGASVDTPPPAANEQGVTNRGKEPIDIEALMLKARTEMVNSAQPDHPAPFLADLSQQRKDAIPTLLYSAHDYRNDGGQSSVLINGKTVHAGGSIGRGVTVDDILPDSVVLSFSGQQFRLTALNSWVNL